MNRIFRIAAVLVFAFLVSCGGDTSAQQSGIPGVMGIIQHDHHDANSGGLLNVPFVKIGRTGTQSITCASFTKVALNNSINDQFGWFDTITNNRFQPLQPGKYLIIATLTAQATTLTGCTAYFYKNGSTTIGSIGSLSSGSTMCSASLPWIESFNGSTDYLELWGTVNGASSCIFAPASSIMSFFSATRIAN